MQAAGAMLKLYNSAEQSVNLPARGMASHGGSLFFMCNKAVSMLPSLFQAPFKWL